MLKNAFALLQKMGRSLMLPVSVLPAAGILLGALSMCAALYLLSQGEIIGGVVLLEIGAAH